MAFHGLCWKYLFFIGGSLALIALWIRLGIGETPVFSRIKREGEINASFGTAIKQRIILRLLFWFLGMMGLALSFFQFVPLILGGGGRIYYALAMMLTLPFLLVFAKIYNKRIMSVWGLLVTLTAIPLFYFLPKFYILAILIGIITQAPWGAMPSLVTSFFKPCIRSTSVGLTVSIGMALGIWYTLSVSLLHEPLWLSSSIFLSISGILVALSSRTL